MTKHKLVAPPKALLKLRDGIDAVDNRIVALLNRRAALAQKIGHIKARAEQPAYVPERERQLLNRLVAINQGPLGGDSIRLIYKEIISASLALECPLQVAFVGPQASLTHAAAKQHFGSSARLEGLRTVADVFAEVEAGRCEYGVVSLESSSEGLEHRTVEQMVRSDLLICAELQTYAGYFLATRRGDMRGVTKVFAHPEAIENCRAWLQQNLPEAQVICVLNTVQAVALLHDDCALLTQSDIAATLYGLRIAAKNLESAPGHVARFAVVGTHEAVACGDDRTSLLFATKAASGSLYDVIQLLARNKINMTRIESRPARRRGWDALFFVDVDGHKNRGKLAQVLAKMAEQCRFFKILGSYPKARSGAPSGGGATVDKEL